MYNKELENAPYRIWFAKVDENGEVISVEVHDKKYKSMSRAWTIASNLSYEKGPDYRFRVAKRNPWKVYERTITCERCGEEFKEPETVDGWSSPDHCRVFYCDHENYSSRVNVILCPDCVRKTIEFLGVKEGVK